MPVRLLANAEKERMAGFPREIPTEDLYAHFTLTGRDRSAIPANSAPSNRLGFVLSLCAVRYLGFCPENLSSCPESVLWYVSQQVGIASEALASYPEREQTRTDHLGRIYAHLGYRRPTTGEMRELLDWLVERALEHDDPSLLVRLASEKLKAERIVRPGVSSLERMVAAARERTDGQTYRALSHVLDARTRARLDELLDVDPSLSPPRTRHAWLKEGATSNTPKAILDQLDKLAFLRDLGGDSFDVSGLNPNRLRFLAALGRRHTNQALKRCSTERRYPILVAFLHEAHAGLIDEIVDLFDACLAHADARSRRELEEFRKGAARATNEKVRLFRELALVVLDPTVDDAAVREIVHEKVGPPEELLDLVEEAERLMRPPDDNHLDFFAARYPYVRRFAPRFLSSFHLRSNRPDDPLLAAVDELRELDEESRRAVPDDAPLGFVPAKWGPRVVDADGRIERRHWELCLLLILVSIAGSEGADLSFSADTDMGECLVIGRKSKPDREARATFVILGERPAFPMLGASAARQIRYLIEEDDLRKLEDGPVGGTPIKFGDDTIGQVVNAPVPVAGGWNLSRVADVSLAQTAYQLAHEKRMWLPTMDESEVVGVPISTVAAIGGEIGTYHADINGRTASGGIRGPFDVSKVQGSGVPTYPVLWSNDAKTQASMSFEADSEGAVRQGTTAKERESVNEKVKSVWNSASHCHFNRDFRFNSQSTGMQFTTRRTIGGRAWLSISLGSVEQEKVLVLWANTSFGLLLHWWHANKQQSGRGSIGKTALQTLPVLDITALTPHQLEEAVKLFDDTKS